MNVVIICIQIDIRFTHRFACFLICCLSARDSLTYFAIDMPLVNPLLIKLGV